MLENTLWRVEIDPATLAIQVRFAGKSPVSVSRGADPHTVTSLEQDKTTARWQWTGTPSFRLEASLEGADLRLSLQADAPNILTFLRQPSRAIGKGLILPLAEGSYVPAGDALWQRFLLEQKNELNTTEDLSLPLWGMDHGSFSLHWLLTNPFNNTLTFASEGAAGLTLTANHKFTRLAPWEPLTFLLHLATQDTDLLAGAKRYRTWLIANKRFEPLAEKLARTPEARKLIGASHIYLWGNGLLAPRDVRDWPAFLAILRRPEGFASELHRQMDADGKEALAQAGAKPFPYQQRVLIRAVNAALNTLARKSWQTAEPDIRQLSTRYGQIRAQVARTFGAALTTDPTRWGGGLSVATFTKLRDAGLTRLWIGLGDGWEGGLWHPEAVRVGVKAGYLLAPYDSYETALPPGVEPDWATAHLGEKAYREGAILLEDGKLKAGFRQMGHYTDPRSVQPILKQRVRTIQVCAGFNSWFLDAYATGMLFDNYRPSRPITQAQAVNVQEASFRWGADALKLVMGSEGGNAVAARGVFYAHGMQTPVIGWGDPDLQRDKKSLYYLGGWHPGEQPEVFFKSVPMKEPYRAIHFDPAYRLPLYQAVFHDSVITTHHWLFDSLKLRNVQAENELAQLLYNVPPLYHLSADTLATRLPIIQRQNAFFRPLHERLALQALTGFRWLSSDRQVQETRFADGTRLIANFSRAGRTINGQDFPALSLTALQPGGPAATYRVQELR